MVLITASCDTVLVKQNVQLNHRALYIEAKISPIHVKSWVVWSLFFVLMQIIAPMKQRRKCGAIQWVLKVSGFTLLCFSCNPTHRFIWMTNVSLFSFLYLKWHKTRGKLILSVIISSKRNIVSFGKTISNFKSYLKFVIAENKNANLV